MLKIISHEGFTKGKAEIKTAELVLTALLLPLKCDHSFQAGISLSCTELYWVQFSSVTWLIT